METKTLTHGTTLEGFKAIMAGIGKHDQPNPWTVSDNDGQMYFYDSVAVAEDYGRDEGDLCHGDAVNSSFENARLQIAFTGKSDTAVVIVCEVPEHLIELDSSCENMPHSRSIQCGGFNPEWITHIYTCGVDIWEIPYILACVVQNHLFNWGDVEEKLVKLANVLANSDDGFDDLYDYDMALQELDQFIKVNA